MSRDPIERFEERWREWAERPPRTSPREAARQVLARLEEPRPAPARRWLAAAAAVLLTAGLWLARPNAPGPRQAGPEAADAAGLGEPPPLAQGVALIWLDPETPLYMTLLPPRADDARAQKGNST